MGECAGGGKMVNGPDGEPMSSSDALIWHIERDPRLRSTIMSVWFLDSAPDQLRMRTTIERTASELERLHQRVVQFGSRPHWVDVDVDLDRHYEFRDLGGKATRDDAMSLAQDWVNEPFDRSRPLWQMAILGGLEQGRAAMVLKVHHAIADGAGFVLMLAALADLEANPAERLSLPATPTPASSPRIPLRRRLKGVKASLKSAGAISASAISIAKLVMPTRTPLSKVMAERSNRLRLDTCTVPLAALKHAAKRHQATINDAFVAVVLDAVDRYHLAAEVKDGKIRLHMPINIRHAVEGDRSGNQFVPARVVLGLAAGSPGQRLSQTSRRLTAIRDEPALPWINKISAAVQRLGVPASRFIIGGMMKGVDVLASNVPGPPFPLYLSGVRVDEFFAFGPLTGAALNITLFSYDGSLHLGVTTDTEAVASRELFLRCLDEAINEVGNDVGPGGVVTRTPTASKVAATV